MENEHEHEHDHDHEDIPRLKCIFCDKSSDFVDCMTPWFQLCKQHWWEWTISPKHE